ncbi:dihydropteroate synthase [Opitutus sp. ER46]|uniref:dihydropteroate synthase n=1 Tax=Opitutus sp. ER46 TaxID=2161864 RepID=UPI000D304368|nr:dihydropteroate synthase [Opitutus sp. ER46]PTX92685.1 dihydropteroate synthase [Opitutus sp. ER46]
MAQWMSPHGRSLPVVGRRTLVMGILNMTPDSFSDGGQLRDLDAVLARAEAMILAGADVLDIGGESTRPGGAPVAEADERARVLPAIEAIRRRFPAVAMSVDTFKPTVAAAAIEAGADIVNDVWGFTHGMEVATRAQAIAALGTGEVIPTCAASAMAAVVARLGCPAILMHNRPDREYRAFWPDVLNDLRLSLALAERAGVAAHQLWLDPGFGFAKSPAQNLEVIKHLERIVALGFPVLVGTSRKSTLGKVLGGAAVDDRMEGSAATAVWAIQRGAAMVRVHDVATMKRIAVVTDAIAAGEAWSEDGSQKPEVGSRKPEARSQKPEA